MGLLQQKKGSAWENEFAQILSRNGFWATVLPKQRDGSQPMDVVAGKQGKIYNFDCKTIKGSTFPLSRIEENQVKAFEKLSQCSCYANYFVIKCDDGTMWMHDAEVLIAHKNAGIKSINPKEGIPLLNWVVSKN